jgi:hypothetical protein
MGSGLNPANPILVSAFRSALMHQWAIVAFTAVFTRQEGLGQAPNWPYLTGSLSQLHAVWRLDGAAAVWSKIQTIDVPLHYGSSS